MISTILLTLLSAQACFYAQDEASAKSTASSKRVAGEHSYILKASPGKGIGVVALHDIPAGSPISDRVRFKVKKCKSSEIPQELLGLCTHLENGYEIAPERFDQLPIFWYLNHSDTPNVSIPNGISVIDNEWLIMEMYAIRDIVAGEELYINYNELGEPEQSKEDFYRK